jgi:hypothetical protein
MKRKTTKKKQPVILTRVLVVETLELMKLVERTEEYADCHLWTGSTTSQGYPTYKAYGCGCTLVRRAVFVLNGGVLNPRVPVEMTCGEKLCINPAHMKASTCSAIGKKAGARGAWSGKARAAKIAAAKRAKHAKLNIELAREIRLSDEPTQVLVARHGVDRSLINGIRAGTRWKDYSSPFAGLMA